MGVGTAISAGLGGASLLGGLMGGGGKSGGGGGSTINVQPSPYEQQMAQMATEYYQQTDPLRQAMLGDFMGFLRPSTGQTTYTPGTTTTTGTTGAYTGASTPGGYQFPSFMQGKDLSQQMAWAQPYTSQPAKPFFDSTTGKVSYYPSIEQITGLSQADLINKYGAPPDATTQSDLIGGTTNPAYQTWLGNITADVRAQQAAQQAIQGAGLQGGTQTTSTTPAGFTSSGLYNPYNLPGYAPLYQLARTGLESQYNPARQSIMESTPRGGALYENLANLEMSRAQQAGSLPATIAAPLISDIYNKAYGVAFNAPQTSIAGLSSAMGGYNALQGLNASSSLQQAALANQNGLAGSAGLGSLAALGLGGLGGKSTGGKSSFSGGSATGGLTYS